MGVIREANRLMNLGAAATEEELDALRDWKVDVLYRIAHDPGPYAGGMDAEAVQATCLREARALRLGLPSPSADSLGELDAGGESR